jgi:ketosteroid isomerase-like protein
MKNLAVSIALATMALCAISCGEQGAGNTANKPANAANVANANTAGNSAAAEAEIKKLMDTTQAALGKNDADAMEKVYAENYMLVNIDGSVQNRSERMASLRSGESKYDSFAYTEPNVRINSEGNGAVVIAKLTMKGMFKGKPMDGTYRVTHVYSKTKDGWRLASAQATKIEGATTPGTAANTANTANTAPANK